MITASSIVSLSLLARIEAGRFTQKEFEDLFCIQSGDLQAAFDNHSKMTRIAFVVLIQFQIENLFRNLLVALSGKSPTRFHSIVKTLLDAITIDDRDTKLKWLNVPAWIRNSLHSNGIHKTETQSVDVNGFLFEFVKGQQVLCAGWGHTIHTINSSIMIIEQILNTPELLKLPDPVEDRYAKEFQTEASPSPAEANK